MGFFQPIFVYLLMPHVEMMRPVFIRGIAFSVKHLGCRGIRGDKAVHDYLRYGVSKLAAWSQRFARGACMGAMQPISHVSVFSHLMHVQVGKAFHRLLC